METDIVINLFKLNDMMKMKEFDLLRVLGISISIFGILVIIFGNVKTPENFQMLSNFGQNILVLNAILLIIMPKNRRLKIVLIIGVAIMVFDFVFEVIAVGAGWWILIGDNLVLGLPIEMVISFLFIGTATGLILYLPEKIREMDFKLFNWLKPLVKNPRYDLLWKLLIVLALTIISTYGDLSGGVEMGVWAYGPNWHSSFVFILNGWLYIGLIALSLQYVLEKKFPEESLR